MLIAPGSTSRSVTMYAWDATTGLPYQTAAFGDAGIALWYRRGVTGAKTAISPVTLAALTTAWTSGGFLAIDENAYRLDVPDAAFAAGVGEVEIGGSATAWVLTSRTVSLPVWLTPTTGATVRAVNAADAALSTYAGGAVASVTGSVGSMADAGASLTALGDVRLANLDAAITSREADGAATTAVGTLNDLSQADVRTAVGLAAANLDTQIATLPTAAEVTDAVWDEAKADHTTPDTFGDYLDDEVSAAVAAGGGAAPTAAAIADAVWDEATSGHVAAGSFGAWASNLVASIWAYTRRVLTGSNPATPTADFTIVRGDTNAVDLTCSTAPSASYTKMWVTLKTADSDADADSMLQVVLTAPAAVTDGLLYENGSARADLSLALTDATISSVDVAGSKVVLTVKPAASSLLEPRARIVWDVQQSVSGVITTIASGTNGVVSADATRATS